MENSTKTFKKYREEISLIISGIELMCVYAKHEKPTISSSETEHAIYLYCYENNISSFDADPRFDSRRVSVI